MAASRLPIRLCVTLEIAAGTAVSGLAAKWVFASTAARPEFCIPTSIEIARASGLANPKTLAASQPSRKPSE